jgi:hypothetical protein
VENKKMIQYFGGGTGRLTENGRIEFGESWNMIGSDIIFCCSDSVSQKLDIA